MTEDYQGLTPPPELVQRWRNAAPPLGLNRESWIATAAARWGADQQLEQCVAWLDGYEHEGWAAEMMRNACRPKPPSLKEQALQAAQRFYAKGHENCTDEEVKDDFDTIRRALEQLDD